MFLDRRGPISRRASYGGDIGFRRRSLKIARKKYNSISCGKGFSRRRERDGVGSDEDGLYDPHFTTYEDYDSFQGNKSDKRLSQSG